MDEKKRLSWQARLARSNINILDIAQTDSGERWFYEFMYHPRPGQTKWSKTFLTVPSNSALDKVATSIEERVLELRKELER